MYFLLVDRLYSCLANGSADEFQKGEHLFKAKAVKEPLQIGMGMHLVLGHLNMASSIPFKIANNQKKKR